ncbi:unnamed protein product [Closterium sp. NIES-53]
MLSWKAAPGRKDAAVWKPLGYLKVEADVVVVSIAVDSGSEYGSGQTFDRGGRMVVRVFPASRPCSLRAALAAPHAAPSGPLSAPAALLAAPCGPLPAPCCCLPCALRCPASPHYACCGTMASLRVLAFDHEGRPKQFDTWLDDLQLYLLSDSRDSVSLFDHTSGAAPAPPATTDSATRSQWLTRDAAARLPIRNHLLLAECAHFGQHRTPLALYDAVVARYSSPATATLGRLLLPYLFPKLSAFATVENLVSHLRTSDARYRDAAPAEFLDRNQPPKFITLYFLVTRLPDSLRSVRDHILSLDPTILTIDLLEQYLLAAETSVVTVGAARGTPHTPFFEGCSPSPLAPSYASAAAVDVPIAKDVGSASTSAKSRSSKGKGGKGGSDGSRSGGGGSSGGDGGSGGGGSGGSGCGSGDLGGGGGGSGGSGGSGSGGCGGGSGSCPYVIRMGDRAGQTCGKPHTQHRCFSRLDDAWRAEFGDEAERPRWAEQLRSGVAIFDLDYDALLSAMYALSVSAKGDCYLCVPPDPGIAAAALGASESVLPGTTPAEALHTFTLDSGASRYFFRDSTTLTPLSAPVPVRLVDPSVGPILAHSSTVLPCPTFPSGSLSGLHLPSFSTNLTLLWDHRLGHPSLPRLCGMHSRLLVSGLPRSLPPLPPSPAPPCLPCVEGRQHAAPHSSSFPSTTAPLQTLHMDVWGPSRISGQGHEHYFMLIVDDYTRYTTVFPLRSKAELNLWPCVSVPETSPTLRWTGKVGDASVFRVWGSRAFVRDTSADKLSARAFPCVFLGFPRDAPGWQFCHPTLHRVLSSQDVTFEESVPFYRLFPYRSAPPPPPTLFLAPGPPPVDPLPPQGHAPSGVSQVDPLPGVVPVEVAGDSGAARSAASRGVGPGGADPGGAESKGAGSGGAEPGGAEREGAEAAGVATGGSEPEGVEPGGTESEGAESGVAEPRGFASSRGPAGTSLRVSPRPEPFSPQQLREWLVRRIRLRGGAAGAGATGDTGAGGARVTTGASGAGGAAAVGPGGARTRGTKAAGTGGVGGAGAGDPAEPRAAGIGGAGGGGTGAGGAGAGGAGAGGARAGGVKLISAMVVEVIEVVVVVEAVEVVEVLEVIVEVVEIVGVVVVVVVVGVAPEGTVSGGAEPARAASGGALGVPSRREPLSPQRLREWYSRRCRVAAGAGAAGAGAARGAGGATGAPGGAGAAGGAAGAGATGAAGGAAGAPGSAGDAGGAAGTTGGAGAGGAGGAAGTGDPGAEGTGSVSAVSGGAARPRPYFLPPFQQVLVSPPSPGPPPPSPFLSPPPVQSQSQLQPPSPLPGPSPYSGPTRGLTERREPESRPVSPESRPASPLRTRVPLPSPPVSSLPDGLDPESDFLRATSPTVTRFLATAVTDPLFESSAASSLVAELVDFAAACRLEYAASLVAESMSVSVCPLSVGGEFALGTDVLEDRQEDLECFAAASPHLVSMLLAPEGDPNAPDISTPRSYAEAIEDEVPPPGANIVSGMWIFRVKRPPGSPPAFEARYVARGFSQRQGVDFFQTFSPTPKMTTLWVLLHVAAQRDYELHSYDFSTAFLQGSLHKEIWLCRPPGFTGSFPAGTQWRLRQPVHGLRQAPCEWHETLRTNLAALGFAPSTADPSLFLRTNATLPSFYVLVYVDDLVFATADTEALAHVKSELQKRHTCTDLGELTSYLGLRITRDRAQRTITLTQSHMVQQVLQRFDFTYSSPQSTPLPTGHSLSAPPSDESVEPSGPYPELVGCLMYLMTCTRPDLAYPLSLLARYVAPGRHRKVHWDAAKRVLRYLCSTSGMGLVLGGRARVVLTGHADASWVDDLATQRSSQGYTFSLGSGSVSWQSTRSSSVLSSSCEAEIYAGAMPAQELRWLTYLLTDLGEAPRSPPANTADVFTKALQPCDHQHFFTVLGGTGAGGSGAGGAGGVDPGARGAGARGAGGTGAGGNVRLRPYFPASPLPTPSPYTEQTGGLTERCEPTSHPSSLVRTGRRVPRPHPPPFPGTNAMVLRPSSVPLRVPLPIPPESSLPTVSDPESDLARAASPTVSRLLATVVTDPCFESTAASALIAELLDFAAACHLDYATALIAESASASPPSIGGKCALGTHVLEDRQEDFDCLATAVPRFASMLLAPQGDPDAPDIPTMRSYAEAITVPSSRANIVDGMWIFRVKRPPGSPPTFKARYVARGFSQRQGVDYFQTFSPTLKMTTLRVLLHVAAQRDYELHSLDFNTAFLQGSLHEEIKLRRPPGFTGSFPAVKTTLAALGFTPSTADPSLFLRTDKSLPPFYVLVYVLQRFGFQFSSPQPTPLSTGHSLSAPPSEKSVELSGPYPELVGSLITSGMGLVLGGRGPLVLTSHANASWVDDSATQRSSQGYTFSLGSGFVSWRSTRLSSVLSSSCEAEIYAWAMAAQELHWLTYLLTDLGEQPRSPPVLYVDNKAMIALCQEHRTKHIALRYFLARELQQRGQLRFAYMATRANTADIFTKALPHGDHQRFSTVLGLLAFLFLTGLLTQQVVFELRLPLSAVQRLAVE